MLRAVASQWAVATVIIAGCAMLLVIWTSHYGWINLSKHDIEYAHTVDRDFSTRLNNAGKANHIPQCSVKKRRKSIQDACQNIQLTNSTKLGHYIINNERKLIYCFIQKVSCTTWKFLMAQSTRDDLHKLSMVNTSALKLHKKYTIQTFGLQLLPDLSRGDQWNKLREYTTFVVVRHPLKRLLSAYLDKFVRNKPPFTLRYLPILEARLGSLPVIKGHKFLPFKGFLRMLVAAYSETDPQVRRFGGNGHWQRQSLICNPCLADFDYVARLETMEYDQRFLLPLLNATVLPRLNDITSGFDNVYNLTIPSYEEAYKSIPQNVMNGIYNVYSKDFHLFGYQPYLYEPCCLFDDADCC